MRIAVFGSEISGPPDPGAMTLDIALVLAILLGAVVLFVTGWLRMDVVAIVVLLAVGITGLVSPREALSGFSSPAVVTVWAMFIISGGLALTGVADGLGRRLIKVAGSGEARLVVTLMITAGLLSATMNNVGVVAIMLPVAIDMARRTGHAPSRLLIPLALAAHMGGLTTLIGTPPNILVADALRDYGLPPFHLFDFTPVGGAILLAGTAFVALVGRRLLPRRDPLRDGYASGRDPGDLFELGERLLTLHLAPDSPLAGRTLERSRLGSALRVNVVAVIRRGTTRLAPTGDTVLEGGDRLVALGRMEFLKEARRASYLVPEPDPVAGGAILEHMRLKEGRVHGDSPLAGKTLSQAGLRERLGVSVLAIRRAGEPGHVHLRGLRFQPDDVLLLHCEAEDDRALGESGELADLRPVPADELWDVYRLPDTLMTLSVPEASILAGRTLAESRLRDVFGLTVWGIRRDGAIRVMPDPEDALQPGDTLLVQGTPQDLDTLYALRKLTIESHPLPDLHALESANVGLAEIVLSPETTLEGRTLRDLDFRDRYGVTVLAIWRQGRAYRTNLRDMEIRFGDAILVHGARDRLRMLTRDPDFVVLTEPATPRRREKAPLAVAILAVALAPVLLGWLDIALAAIAGAVLMVLTRCLTMEDAYRFIEWPAVFLIAGMLPLGIAMERTGAARFLAEGVLGATGPLGPRAVLAGLFLVTSVAAQIVPTAAVVVLMAPIGFNAAANLGASPLPFLMTIAMASVALWSPVSHPANALVMGPGGYRFVDYVRVGLPLTLVAFVIVILLVPLLWPFVP